MDKMEKLSNLLESMEGLLSDEKVIKDKNDMWEVVKKTTELALQVSVRELLKKVDDMENKEQKLFFLNTFKDIVNQVCKEKEDKIK